MKKAFGYLYIATLMTVMSLLCGCASHDSLGIMGSGVPIPLPGLGGYGFAITSKPPGAEIYFNGQLKGKAPITWTRRLLLQTIETDTIEAWFPNSLTVGRVSGNHYVMKPRMVENADVLSWGSPIRLRFYASPQTQREINPETVSPAILDQFYKIITADGFVQTNTNWWVLQTIADVCTNNLVATNAAIRLDQLLDQSTNLTRLIQFALSMHQTGYTEKADRRVNGLIEDLGKEQGVTGIKTLLKIGCASQFHGSSYAKAATAAAEKIIKSQCEIVSQDEYKREFSAPDGTLLTGLMDEIREKQGIANDTSFSATYVVDNNTTQTSIYTTPVQDNEVKSSFSMAGLEYERTEYTGTGIVHEVITRSASSSKAKVITEAYHFDGSIYHLSHVTGL